MTVDRLIFHDNEHYFHSLGACRNGRFKRTRQQQLLSLHSAFSDSFFKSVLLFWSPLKMGVRGTAKFWFGVNIDFTLHCTFIIYHCWIVLVMILTKWLIVMLHNNKCKVCNQWNKRRDTKNGKTVHYLITIRFRVSDSATNNVSWYKLSRKYVRLGKQRRQQKKEGVFLWKKNRKVKFQRKVHGPTVSQCKGTRNHHNIYFGHFAKLGLLRMCFLSSIASVGASSMVLDRPNCTARRIAWASQLPHTS